MIEYTPGDSLWRYFCRLHGSVVPQALTIAAPSLVLTVLLIIFEEQVRDFREEIGLSPSNSSVIWAAVTAPLITLISFRTSQAWGRFWEGTSLLHAMRGEWFDSASCLVTFTVGSKPTKEEEVMNFRHTLIRLMSLCHGSALDELKIDQTESYEVLDLLGLDEDTLQLLCQSKVNGFNRVEVLLHLTQVLVTVSLKNGIIDVPPPVLSRVYQTLSRGFVNLLNAKKIKDTAFPFPHAQAIAVLLLTLAVLTPLVMTTLVNQTVLACFATFIPIFGLSCLNYTAGELEMPFGDDANDLPLTHFQQEMNSSLLMLMNECSDHVPALSKKAIKDFHGLNKSLHDSRNSMANLEHKNNMVEHDGGPRRARQSMFVAAVDEADPTSGKHEEVDDTVPSIEEVQEDPELSSIWTPQPETPRAGKPQAGASLQSTDVEIQGPPVPSAHADSLIASANLEASEHGAKQPATCEAQDAATHPRQPEAQMAFTSACSPDPIRSERPAEPPSLPAELPHKSAAHAFQAMLQSFSPRGSLGGRRRSPGTSKELSQQSHQAATGQPSATVDSRATPGPNPQLIGTGGAKHEPHSKYASFGWGVAINHANV